MKKEFVVIGLMSGTSLDGLDIAACRFVLQGESWSFQILQAESVSYDENMKARLADSVNLSGLDLAILDLSLGRFFGEQVKAFCSKYQLAPLFISSHGHTVFHQPEKQLTLQIGSGEAISQFSGLPVVCNFRVEDVLKGGQGAPLVPVGEKFLFPAFQAFLNLGGIANIAVHSHEGVVGYDVSCCNMALNYLAGQKGLRYDRDGQLAASGSIVPGLLDQLNTLPFFSAKGPKSLGYEWFSEAFCPLLDQCEASVEDKLATVVQHVAGQVNRDIALQVGEKKCEVLATGGGALNRFLAGKLNELGDGLRSFHVPDRTLVEYKEALIFAFLGLRRVLDQYNVSRLVTGAASDTSAGSFHGPFSVKIS